MREGRSRGGRRWGLRMRARGPVTALRGRKEGSLRAWLRAAEPGFRSAQGSYGNGQAQGVGELPPPRWPLVVSTNQSNPHYEKIKLLPSIETMADFLSHIKTVEKSSDTSLLLSLIF